MKTTFVLFLSIALATLGWGCKSGSEMSSVNSKPQTKIPPSDSRFLYEGRFDFADANSPVVIWQASRIRLDFDGDSLRLLFDQAKGQNFFNADVDGTSRIVEVDEGSPAVDANFE